MTITIRDVKNAIREALTEENEAGIQPVVVPPLAAEPGRNDSAVRTEEVIQSLLRHKRYRRIKPGTVETYRKHFYRFARQFPTLPLETTVIMEYLERFDGQTGRYRRNQHDLLSMLYEHATSFFSVAANPLENLERPQVTHRQIRTLSLAEARRVEAVINTATEWAVWELTFGHGWRQVAVRRLTAGDVRSVKDGVVWCRDKERDEYTPLLPETQEKLERLAEGLSDDEPVIRGRRIRSGKTQPLGEDGIRALIKELFNRCGIIYKGHDLRRTFCTLVREASGDELLAMRLARDKIPGVNDRYINTSPVKLGESLQKYSPVRLLRHEQTGESLVETGESRTPRPREAAQNMLQA